MFTQNSVSWFFALLAFSSLIWVFCVAQFAVPCERHRFRFNAQAAALAPVVLLAWIELPAYLAFP